MWLCSFRSSNVMKDAQNYQLTFWLHPFPSSLAANAWWKAFPMRRGILSRIWNSWVLCFITALPHECANRNENKTKSKLARPMEWVRKKSDSAWRLQRADSGVFAFFLHRPDPGSEVAYLHPILSTLLLSILRFLGWVQFSLFRSSFLRLPFFHALSRLLFITR